MSVETKYGLGYKDPNSIALPKATNAMGRLRLIASGPLALSATASIGSKQYFGKIPSSAIIVPALSTLYHYAATSLTDYDIGLEHDGTVIIADVLANGLDLHTAGSKAICADVASADIGKRMWELALLTSDPGYEFDIVGVLKAAATAAGSINAMICFGRK